jgi:iron complex transport system permease protein
MSATTVVRPIALGPSLGRSTLVIGVGLGLLAVGAAVAVALGTSGVGPDQALAIVVHRLAGIGPVTWPASAETIVWELRLPRVVAAMVVGAGLACAGTVFQAVLRNPLADPYIIGTAAGASLGAVAALVLPFATVGWLGIGAVQAFAFIGGLGAVLVVYAVARDRGGTPVVTLLLAGYAVSSLLAAGVAFLLFASGDRLAAVVSWLLGSLAGASWPRLAIAGPLIVISFTLIILRWRRCSPRPVSRSRARSDSSGWSCRTSFALPSVPTTACSCRRAWSTARSSCSWPISGHGSRAGSRSGS